MECRKIKRLNAMYGSFSEKETDLIEIIKKSLQLFATSPQPIQCTEIFSIDSDELILRDDEGIDLTTGQITRTDSALFTNADAFRKIGPPTMQIEHHITTTECPNCSGSVSTDTSKEIYHAKRNRRDASRKYY